MAVPLLLLLVLVSVHLGLWYHARQIVDASAQEAARTARSHMGSDIEGTRKAEEMLRKLGPRSVSNPSIVVSRTTETVTVTVSGDAPSVVPGLALPVTATVTSPLEEFRR